MDNSDLLILGSGSTAFAAAIRAAELGFSAVMTERRTLGGTCVNRGCLPSKNLIAAAELWHGAREPRFTGLPLTRGTLDFAALVRQKDDVVASMVRKKYESVLGGQIDIIYGDAKLTGPNSLRVDGHELIGRHVLIATGARPAVPPIDGLEAVPYLTSDLLTVGEGMEMNSLPASLAIVGGGYIACELGQMFARFGSDVTILERGERLLMDSEPEISFALRDVLERESVDVTTETTATHVQQRSGRVVVTTALGDEIEAERLLIATGRTPNSDNIGLEDAGIAMDERGFVRVDEQLRTSVPGIWAAGDVRDGHMATPVGAHDGVIAADNALASAGRATDYRVVPRAIFTDPPIASVGLTDAEASAQGISCRCVTTPMELVPRAAAVHRTDGLLKMVAERDSGRVVGVHMMADSAHEVIHEAAMALRFGATLDDFIDQVHVYPTMAEALKIGALAFTKDVRKLSCCAE